MNMRTCRSCGRTWADNATSTACPKCGGSSVGTQMGGDAPPIKVVGSHEPKTFDSATDTYKHANRVHSLMLRLTDELIHRASLHDRSKLESPEKEVFDEFTPKLQASTYGSEEYKSFLAAMKPALDHHYGTNPHHPEYHKNGVAGMTLVDLIEMLCDWKAASERHADGDLKRSIELNRDRFRISDQLVAILLNTAKLLEGT